MLTTYDIIAILIYRKIMELEEELKVVGNSLKSLEVSEEKVINVKILRL